MVAAKEAVKAKPNGINTTANIYASKMTYKNSVKETKIVKAAKINRNFIRNNIPFFRHKK